MTYRELLEKLKTFTDAQLDNDVRFYNDENQWFMLSDLLFEPCLDEDGHEMMSFGGPGESEAPDPDCAWFFGYD